MVWSQTETWLSQKVCVALGWFQKRILIWYENKCIFWTDLVRENAIVEAAVELIRHAREADRIHGIVAIEKVSKRFVQHKKVVSKFKMFYVQIGTLSRWFFVFTVQIMKWFFLSILSFQTWKLLNFETILWEEAEIPILASNGALVYTLFVYTK